MIKINFEHKILKIIEVILINIALILTTIYVMTFRCNPISFDSTEGNKIYMYNELTKYLIYVPTGIITCLLFIWRLRSENKTLRIISFIFVIGIFILVFTSRYFKHLFE